MHFTSPSQLQMKSVLEHFYKGNMWFLADALIVVISNAPPNEKVELMVQVLSTIGHHINPDTELPISGREEFYPSQADRVQLLNEQRETALNNLYLIHSQNLDSHQAAEHVLNMLWPQKGPGLKVVIQTATLAAILYVGLQIKRLPYIPLDDVFTREIMSARDTLSDLPVDRVEKAAELGHHVFCMADQLDSAQIYAGLARIVVNSLPDPIPVLTGHDHLKLIAAMKGALEAVDQHQCDLDSLAAEGSCVLADEIMHPHTYILETVRGE